VDWLRAKLTLHFQPVPSWIGALRARICWYWVQLRYTTALADIAGIRRAIQRLWGRVAALRINGWPK
jgi:hypothetical protein